MNGQENNLTWVSFLEKFFNDLPEENQLHTALRCLIAGGGMFSFFIAYLTVHYIPKLLVGQDTPINLLNFILIFLIALFLSGVLGFILAWKREKSGPVRLYVSGIVLSYFLFFSASLVQLLS